MQGGSALVTSCSGKTPEFTCRISGFVLEFSCREPVTQAIHGRADCDKPEDSRLHSQVIVLARNPVKTTEVA